MKLTHWLVVEQLFPHRITINIHEQQIEVHQQQLEIYEHKQMAVVIGK